MSNAKDEIKTLITDDVTHNIIQTITKHFETNPPQVSPMTQQHNIETNILSSLTKTHLPALKQDILSHLCTQQQPEHETDTPRPGISPQLGKTLAERISDNESTRLKNQQNYEIKERTSRIQENLRLFRKEVIMPQQTLPEPKLKAFTNNSQ